MSAVEIWCGKVYRMLNFGIIWQRLIHGVGGMPFTTLAFAGLEIYK
jgi:hypothetical protein